MYNRSMRTHIWIRKDDEPIWKSIEDKPEWLHAALNPRSVPIAGIIKFVKESGALDTGATLQQFVDYLESLQEIKDGLHE